MACTDSMEVLDQLVRTGLWAKADSIFRFRYVVLDVDSIVLSLHRHCVSNHLERQQKVNKGKPNLYSATLVNYIEFSRYVRQLFDYFDNKKIEPILVYAGKPMEAPLFGLQAAEFKKNTQKVRECMNIVNNYDKLGFDGAHNLKSGRPSLALIIFKSIVNSRRKSGAKTRVVQSFYSPYPHLARMARDFRCPVITSNGDFIIMDVRAGFILFEEFWSQYILRGDSKSGPKSSSKLGSKSARGSIESRTGLDDKKSVYFHYNRMFLIQHPGLNAALAMNLFPLTTVDFVTSFKDSLKRLEVFDTAYKEKDFMLATDITSRLAYKRHHMAADRLEMVLRFLSINTVQILGSKIRGEATRTNTSFDDDFRNLFNFYAVSYEFKHRLRFALKYLHDPVQLNYIEWCLINRESTADYLLDLLCCSIGRLASVSYNKYLQFEDFQTKHSAFWLKNHSKSMLMSLFTANKSHKGEHSVSLSSKNKQQDTTTRYSTAALTLVDRQLSSLAEFTLNTTHENNPELDLIRPKLQLAELAHRKVAREDCIKFINLAFGSKDLTHIPPKAEAIVAKHLDDHSIKSELAIVRSLSAYSLQNAFPGDNQASNYSNLAHHLEAAIVNHYLYRNEILSKRKQSHRAELSALVDLISKGDLENVAHEPTESPDIQSNGHQAIKSSASHKGKSPQKEKKSSSSSSGKDSSRRIRHLIELLGAAIETYCELNSFFEYPLPKLNLHLHYNPILLYNLTLYANNKALLKF